MINLCLVVIATQFSETKKREMERMLQERQRFHSSSTLMSNQELGGCYDEIIRYIAHVGRRVRRKARLFFRNLAQSQGWLRPKPAVTMSLRHRRGRQRKTKDKKSNNCQQMIAPAEDVCSYVTNSHSVEINSGGLTVASSDGRDMNRDSAYYEASDSSRLMNTEANGRPNPPVVHRINHVLVQTSGIKEPTRDQRDSNKHSFGITLPCCQQDYTALRCRCFGSKSLSCGAYKPFLPLFHSYCNELPLKLVYTRSDRGWSPSF